MPKGLYKGLPLMGKYWDEVLGFQGRYRRGGVSGGQLVDRYHSVGSLFLQGRFAISARRWKICLMEVSPKRLDPS